MDITTIIGVLAGIVLIVLAIFMRGGTVSFLDITSAMITFGGAFAATLVNYPLRDVMKVFRIAGKVLAEKKGTEPAKLVDEFVRYAKKSRTQGLLSLEQELKNIQDRFMRRAIELVVAGADQDMIRSELETEITFLQERHSLGQEIFITLGTFSPAFGMIGTIIGLILMLGNLQDQSQIAAGMAVALLTTFYGATAAYLIFLPIAGKLKRRSADEVLVKQIIIEGVLSLQAGEIPSVIDAKLKAFLPPEQRISKQPEKKPGKK